MLDGKPLVIDSKAWYQAYLDTPMSIPKGLTKEQARVVLRLRRRS